MNKNDNKLKILSVLVAIFMWTFVTNSTNPNVNKVFRGIPVVIRNQDDLEKSGYTIIGDVYNFTTTVKLKGSREKLLDLKTDNIFASVDIADLTEGVHTLGVKVETPTGVSVEEIDPNQVNLNIQKVLEKKLPVNYVISDQIKDGRIVELNEIKPKEITVKGPASSINKVDRAEIRIDDANLLDGKVHNISINVLDRSGKAIENLNVSDDDANISFRVFETKRVPVELDVIGSVNPSYDITSATVAPDSVVLKGPESIIKDIESVHTEPISLNNLRSNSSGEVKLKLGESVEVYDGDNIVSYKIELQRKHSTKSDEDKQTNQDNEDE